YQEDFDDIVLDDPSDPNYYTKRLGTAQKSNSGFVMFAPDTAAGNAPKTPTGTNNLDKDGTDSAAAPKLPDYLGNVDAAGKPIADPLQFAGLAALLLDEFRDVSLVYAPNTGGATDITGAIIAHCDAFKYRFAVIDAAEGQANADNITPRQNY